MLPSGDKSLVQIVDTALADAARRSGNWLVCKPGCTQCCVGAFAISQLDAERLRSGLNQLTLDDPDRATHLRQRTKAYIAKNGADYPGNIETGLLGESPEAQELFAAFANDEPCPALDPATGTCDLYTARPMTCRIFGPPVRSEDGLGVCELCYHGASDEEIAACEMHLNTDELEADLTSNVEATTQIHGSTIVAFALFR